MRLCSSWIILFFLGYIFCFGEITSLNNHFVDAKTLQSFSNFDIEKQFKVINKPAVKIIRTTNGDTYGCVDFYKQPAFGNMSMKNKLFHYNMGRTLSLRNSKINNKKFNYLWENGIGCPIGTVPIKSFTKYELLELDLFSKKYKPYGSWNSTNDQQHHFAVSLTKGEKGKIYNGAKMIVSINGPIVKLPQFSSARMHLQIGDDFIQVGWTVNPKLYGDNKTRSFVYTKAGKNQCYNSMCEAGYISVRSDLPIGIAHKDLCVSGKDPSTAVEVSLLKDQKSGNWWLDYGKERVGFWPASRFKQSYANNVEWGGEVYSASMPSPQMGNGFFPEKHPSFDADMGNLTIIDDKFMIDDRVNNTEPFSDNNRGYKVIDDINSEFDFLRHMVYFGGPGNI